MCVHTNANMDAHKNMHTQLHKCPHTQLHTKNHMYTHTHKNTHACHLQTRAYTHTLAGQEPQEPHLEAGEEASEPRQEGEACLCVPDWVSVTVCVCVCVCLSVCLSAEVGVSGLLASLSVSRTQTGHLPPGFLPTSPGVVPTFLSPPWLLAVGTYCLG